MIPEVVSVLFGPDLVEKALPKIEPRKRPCHESCYNLPGKLKHREYMGLLSNLKAGGFFGYKEKPDRMGKQILQNTVSTVINANLERQNYDLYKRLLLMYQ